MTTTRSGQWKSDKKKEEEEETNARGSCNHGLAIARQNLVHRHLNGHQRTGASGVHHTVHTVQVEHVGDAA